MPESKLTVFNLGTGCAVIADEAILSITYSTQTAMGAAAAGGLVGALVGAAIDRRADKKRGQQSSGQPRLGSLAEVREVTNTTVAKLPQSILSDPAWPKLVGADKPVVIFPKALMTKVRASIWKGLTLEVNGHPKGFPVGLAMWHLGRARQHLARAGYPIAA